MSRSELVQGARSRRAVPCLLRALRGSLPVHVTGVECALDAFRAHLARHLLLPLAPGLGPGAGRNSAFRGSVRRSAVELGGAHSCRIRGFCPFKGGWGRQECCRGSSEEGPPPADPSLDRVLTTHSVSGGTTTISESLLSNAAYPQRTCSIWQCCVLCGIAAQFLLSLALGLGRDAVEIPLQVSLRSAISVRIPASLGASACRLFHRGSGCHGACFVPFNLIWTWLWCQIVQG